MAIERKFSLMNFFYGLGAAVILIAALFKFAGWKHADILFMVGLIGEAIIFLVAGLQPIPQYTEEGPKNGLAQTDRSTYGTEKSRSVNELNSMLNSLNEATRNLAEEYEVQSKTLDQNRREYQNQIESINQQIALIRERLRALDEQAGR